MRKPQFEHFRESLLRKGTPLSEHEREPFRLAIIKLLEEEADLVIQKSRKDGHPDALLEIHASCYAPDFTPRGMADRLRRLWPSSIFPDGEQSHWVETEDEVTDLSFAWRRQDGRYITGRIRVVP